MCTFSLRNTEQVEPCMPVISVFFIDAGAVIHTHSKAAVMTTLLTKGCEFRISDIEMIKGIKNNKTGKLNFNGIEMSKGIK